MLFDFYEKSLSFYAIEKILRESNFELFNIFQINNNPMNYRTDWVEVIYKNNNFK